ncbi:acyl-CoA ligase (AMP-forming), exosortase A system-associated [Mitsuaria sp. WAJ17]|uniref:acyl-CoA ligase (AMP-forming), exosortase A system-associated n=1 Tax=Mitsuaria sp. WAJ17 TaxID=2761452 RepID=UPI00160377B0|nr:acyl-CoA ligase (AMP-forming), exosortase A system-associated [Mitsuaria sp. WAJ17]MBB2486237.1 acyl-CoA ligase (AMP-forming), exosortase A system-associated [Mitsuaria sp. WAJ17]
MQETVAPVLAPVFALSPGQPGFPAPRLLADLVHQQARCRPAALALGGDGGALDYGGLSQQLHLMGGWLAARGVSRGERVAVYLDKRQEFVIACFGAGAVGGVFVPVNPVLKAEQVVHILRDCDVRVLVTAGARLQSLVEVLPDCPALREVLLVDARPDALALPPALRLHDWTELHDARPQEAAAPVLDSDMAAILYTSGSTGKPKGVVLSHRNLVLGAQSVAQYLGNHADDVLLAALPLSFDAGFSQLSTGFLVGAKVVLLNYLMPRDVLKALDREGITGLTAVPPLYIQLTQLAWPEGAGRSLRYFANTGGRMPRETLDRLRERLPQAAPFLMYGLTEAFRSTYLPPSEVDRRPDSIGRAIPNAEILVLREDGSLCEADEPGELVHRGPLVGLGYWNDAEKTAERYKPLPAGVGGREAGLQLPEYAVFSGDTVRRDAEGFLYFIGRRDEMIKTSGYRVSPVEVEELLYRSGLVGECAAYGMPHEQLGQCIEVVFCPPEGTEADPAALQAFCRKHMPAYMLPSRLLAASGPLPRNPNGKIDRKRLQQQALAAED